MKIMKLYDAFETKTEANRVANDIRSNPKRPQFVQVKPVNEGRLKWGVFVGGKNCRIW